GKTYSELRRYQEAIEYTQKAVDANKGVEEWLYGSRWEAVWCLATWKSILASGLENEVFSDRGRLRRKEGMTDAEKQALAEKESAVVKERRRWKHEAMEAWRAAYDDNKANGKFVAAYLDFCDGWDEGNEFMALLKKLDGEMTNKEGS